MPGQGGAREGAGRKALGWTQRVEVRLRDEEAEVLDAYCERFPVEGTHGPRPMSRAEAFRRMLDVHARRAVDRG